MPEKVHLNTYRELSCREIAGVIFEATTEAVVERNDGAWPTDATQMQTVLDLVGLPAPGEVFSEAHPRLHCIGRDCRIEDKGIAVVTMSWHHYPTALNGDPAFDRPNSQLTQINTQKDRAGLNIEVMHDDRTQLGEISVLTPEDGFERDVVLTVLGDGFDQYRIKSEWHSRINETAWNNGSAEAWLCTQALPEPLDIRAGVDNHKYIFHFAFAYNELGWQPDVFYRDPATGRPPKGLVPDVGFKTVTWYETRDFNVEPD